MAKNLTRDQNAVRKQLKAQAVRDNWECEWFPLLGVTIFWQDFGHTVRAFWSRAAATDQATRKAGEYHALIGPQFIAYDPHASGVAFDSLSGFDQFTLAEMISAGRRDEDGYLI